MRLAFRFTAALVAAMTLALVLNAYLRVRREVVLFDEDIAWRRLHRTAPSAARARRKLH